MARVFLDIDDGPPRPRRRPSSEVTIFDAVDSPSVWAGWFRDRKSWQPWRVFLAALFGLSLAAADIDLFQQCTGREKPSPGGYLEAWLVIGRRGGKSFMLALVAVYLTIFRDWKPYLSPGESAGVLILAADRRQARVIHKYCRALLTKVPAFATLVERDTDDSIQLTNGLTIDIQTASFRTTRGFTVIAALCDEIAFWRSEDSAANPDREIIRALRPGMATIPGSMLLCASSPYARKGELFNAHKRHFGRPSKTLVWQAPTRTMHPSLPQRVVDDAYEEDPDGAAAEFGAEFRLDVERFIDRELVEAAIDRGVAVRAPRSGVSYRMFVDVSSGRGDSFAMAIGHREGDAVVIDLIYERRPPFNSDAAFDEVAAHARSYRVGSAVGDDYGSGLTESAFRRRRLSFDNPKNASGARMNRSQIYLGAVSLLTSGRMRVPDHQRFVSQITALDRRTGPSGHDVIDHARGQHDDVSNAVCGCAVLLAAKGNAKSFALNNDQLAKLQQTGAVRQRFGFLGPIQAAGRNRFGRNA